ncbi:chymotrypsin inhibitor [Diachasma alloeum]|uniref:chymotrypsin inhibitor n=1 Tax=Diachasma alloeum TaxID=454923 RepID=UPI0007382197|nr:chymotrypsin inhibitor [Diachasma alloeum]
MSRLGLLFILALALVFVGEINAQRRCRRNEIWTRCGSPCPPDCLNPRPRPCPPTCRAGCFCRPGYLRNFAGICVRRC